jgi:carboxymethylenebutenolidase
MGTNLTLTASDGVDIGAYLAEPDGAPRGALVVLQEIFGVNSHIRSVVDRYAAEGFLALAPCVFDRVAPGLELGYTADDLGAGVGFATQTGGQTPILDITAAITELRSRTDGKIGITGFCWGGTFTWLSACTIDGLSAAVGYYGGGIHGMRAMTPKVPTMLHFGDKDVYIPADQLADIQAEHPELPIYTYPANHGFHCDARADYDADSAALAWTRTLEFFNTHLA